MNRKEQLEEIIKNLESPHSDKVYIAKSYTKKDLINDLKRIHSE